MRGDMTGGFDGKFPFENSISLMYATIDFMFSKFWRDIDCFSS